MSFIIKFLTSLFIPLLEWLGGKIITMLSDYQKRRARDIEIEKQNHANTVKLENAKTDEEIKDAAKDVINEFNR